MTKIYKSGDVYNFFNEDTNTSTIYSAEDASKKMKELDTKAEYRNQKASEERYKNMNNQVWRALNVFYNSEHDPSYSIKLDELKEYLKTLKKCKELKVQTGQMLFDEELYNKACEELLNKKRELIERFNSIVNSPSMNVSQKEREAYDVRQELNALNNIIITKDENRFKTPEVITVKLKPLETYEVVKSLYDRMKSNKENDKQSKLDDEIKHDRSSLSGITEEEFKIIKCVDKYNKSYFHFDYKPQLVNSKFENTLFDALHYSSLEEYLNRERHIEGESKVYFESTPNPDKKAPQPTEYDTMVSDSELENIYYFNKLVEDYDNYKRLERLKAEATSMSE